MNVIIIGAGKLGSRLANNLIEESFDVILVDQSQLVIDRLSEHLDVMTVVGNGTDVNLLRELNIENTDILIACTENDEANILICRFAKTLGCKLTIARMRDPEYLKQVDFLRDELQVDHIINPELITANVMSKYLLRDVVFFTAEYGEGKVKMVDFHLRNHMEVVGKALYELDTFKNLLVVAISRGNSTLIPDGNTILEKDDVIHVMGTKEDMMAFVLKYSLQELHISVKRVMILGGGKIGLYLAQNLLEAGVQVTVIESNPERTRVLAEVLEHALIIRGDGTDINLLEEEDIESYDAFVGVTGLDEQNLLMAILAKQYGILKSIAKVSRQNYSSIIDKLPLDAAINPVNISTAEIIKYLRGDSVFSVHLLPDGDAEITELLASEKISVLNIPLKDLGLPKGLIVGAIIRQGRVLIPNGDNVIEAGDRLIIFSLKKNNEIMKKTFLPSKRGILDELWNHSKSIRRTAGR